MKFSCNIRIQQDLLSEANFSCDLKQNTPSKMDFSDLKQIWSETRYLKRCFLSISNEYFLAICSNLKLIYQSKAKFSIWSEIFCDMKRFFCDVKRFPFRYEVNFIANLYEAICVRFEAKSAIWNDFFDTKRCFRAI